MNIFGAVRRIPLLGWIIIAILLGIAIGPIMPTWLGSVFMTYSSIFSGFLGFAVPLIIVGLIMPAIAELGQGAGKWLGVTAAIAYGSTILAGLLAFWVGTWIFIPALSSQEMQSIAENDSESFTPYFTLASSASGSPTEIILPPVFSVMTALVLAFLVGMGLTLFKQSVIFQAAVEFRQIIEVTIRKVIVPALPVYIFSIFMDLSHNGEAWEVVRTFLLVVVVSFSLTIVVLLLQYSVAGAASKQNPIRLLWNMRDAYFTALGTSSSAATIPITLRSALKNGVSEPVAGFTVPLCATIHLSGSMVKITCFSLAILILSGGDASFAAYLPFVLMLGVMMIAAPGVPGGAIAAASGLLAQMLGFGDTELGLMFAAYIALDSFGTATNVTGDGAIAILVDKISQGKIGNASNSQGKKDSVNLEERAIEVQVGS